MKTATNGPKSLCKQDGKGASSACHWRNWKASESAIRPPRPSPTGTTGASADIVCNRLADFAGYGCQDPPCCQLRRLSLHGGFPAALFVFLAAAAGTRIVATDFSLCLTISRSFCGEPCSHPSTLRRKVAVN